MIDVAKIKEKLLRRKPLDKSQDIRRLVGLHRLKTSENWSEYREYLYQQFAEKWDEACAYHDQANQAMAWDAFVRARQLWDLIAEPEMASQQLKTRFQKEEVQKVIEDIDLS